MNLRSISSICQNSNLIGQELPDYLVDSHDFYYR
jgi:hypothetical protein